jgi:hypothetical protein
MLPRNWLWHRLYSANKLKDNDFTDLRGLPALGRLNQNFCYLILDKNGNETS